MQLFPAASPGAPSVLVLHSWWGVTASFVSYAQALAQAGFTTGLADLFDGETARTEVEAAALRHARRSVPAYKRLLADLASLRARSAGPLGLVGFSMGGHWAVWLSQQPGLNIAATVLYYAARAGNFSASRSSYLAHFAGDDPWVSISARRRMERAIIRAGCPYQAQDYAGTGHWFAESARPDAFDAPAAELAFARTRVHLAGCLCR